jgi:hypothetical protein
VLNCVDDAAMLPEIFHTVRLILRPIVPEYAGPIFDRYALDATVTRFDRATAVAKESAT